MSLTPWHKGDPIPDGPAVVWTMDSPGKFLACTTDQSTTKTGATHMSERIEKMVTIKNSDGQIISFIDSHEIAAVDVIGTDVKVLMKSGATHGYAYNTREKACAMMDVILRSAASGDGKVSMDKETNKTHLTTPTRHV